MSPARLRAAVEQAVRDLGREPDLVFLHNPEHSLQETAPQSRDLLAQACAALDDAAAQGLCGGWGVASWDPSPLPNLIDTGTPRPSVLMVRAGLLVGIRTLDAAETLTKAWNLGDGQVWGMSPFGGSTRAPVWAKTDPRVFIQGGNRFSHVQAAFRVAFHLPRVSAIAVGTDDPTHLGELTGALDGEVDGRTIREYRSLLRDRLRSQPA